MSLWKLFPAALVIVALLLPSTSFAHERRQVGKYDVVVGWSSEPAFSDVMNGLDLRVEDRDTKELITGLEKTLKAEAIFGSQRRPLELLPVSTSTPGRYISRFVPAAAGDYRFRIFGTVQGAEIDQTFDSADGKFDSVDALEELRFPANGATAAQTQTQSAQAALQRAQAAEAAAANAQTFALVALGIGGLGLILGIVSMLSPGRRGQA